VLLFSALSASLRLLVLKGNFRWYDATDRVPFGMLHAYALSHLKHFSQHSTPLHGYIYIRRMLTCSRRSYYSCPRHSPSKKVGPRLTRDIRHDILLLRELNDHEDEVEYTYISLSERDACKM